AGAGRAREDVRPGNGDAERAQDVELGVRLDALRNEAAIGRAGEVPQADDHRLARLIRVEVRHQRSIQLDVGGAQLEDVTEAGEAGPGVIDRKPGLLAETGN